MELSADGGEVGGVGAGVEIEVEDGGTMEGAAGEATEVEMEGGTEVGEGRPGGGARGPAAAGGPA